MPGTRIESSDPMNVKVETRDLIPPKYGRASKETITATKTSPNILKFELTSK
ncbi:MAG: hypothetical protein ACRCUY_03945 [Thermoguttaceae bacterium]